MEIKWWIINRTKKAVKTDIKKNLEALVGVVPGLTKMNIRTEFLASSSADIMMDSELESNEALKGYQTHPSHVHVADTYVRPNVSVRLSMDYEIWSSIMIGKDRAAL